MELKIGKVSKMTGLSVSGIRFLEDEGIIKPANGRIGTYRSYDVSNVATLLDFRNYRLSGFSNEQVTKMMKSNAVEDYERGYEEHIIELEQEIRERSKLITFLNIRKRDLAKISEHEHYVELEERPTFLWIPLVGDDLNAWPNAKGIDIPYVDSSLVFESSKLLERHDKLTSIWGVGISESNIEGLDYLELEDFRIFKRHLALHFIVEIDQELCLDTRQLEFYLQDHHLKISSDLAFTKRIISYNDGEKPHRFDHLWIDVEEE